MKHRSFMFRALCVALSLLMALSLAACAKPAEPAQATAAPAAQPAETAAAPESAAPAAEFKWDAYKGATINVLLNQHPYVDPMIADLPAFEALTGIKVKYSIIPEANYFDKVTTQLNSRSGDPDIFMTGPYQIWEYAAAGYMQDLDEFINNPSLVSDDFDKDDFFPSIFNALRWDTKAGHEMGTGPLWGLPMGFESNELVYNKRILDEKGLKVPTTTEELLQVAAALKGHSGPNTYGIALRGERGWGTPITAYMSLYRSWGAKDFEIKDGKLVSVVNSPEAVAMTDWYVKLIQQGGSPTWASATWYSAGGELGAGTAAMMLDASNNNFTQTVVGKSQEAENLVITQFPLPAGKTDADRKSNLWTWALAMNGSSKNKEAAWMFLQYFSGKEYQNKASVAAQIVQTPRKSSFDQPEYQKIIENSKGFVEAFNNTTPGTSILYTPQPNFFEAATEWSATLQDLVEGKYASTQEGMDTLKKKLDEIVADVVVE